MTSVLLYFPFPDKFFGKAEENMVQMSLSFALLMSKKTLGVSFRRRSRFLIA